MRVSLSPTQNTFFKSEEEYVLFAGGLGSGKTHAGALWAIYMALTHPNVRGLITAISYSQLNKATLAKVFELLTEMSIPFNYKKKEGELYIMNSLIYCYSMENFNTLRGIDVGWCWSDECAFYKEEAFNVLIGRIRDKEGPCQWKGTTTPNGFNWLYEAFVEKPFKSTKIIKSKTSDNLANLKSSYVDDLKSQYDTRLAKQELDGEFVNLNAGRVYYTFDRGRHVKNVTDIPFALLYVGIDFNVHPLCGIFAYIQDDKIYVKSEMYLENSDTFQAAKEIIRRYPYQALMAVADETGNRRKTSSKNTDHEILRRANIPVADFKNPLSKDRFNNVNRLMEQGKIIIDPSCKYLIKDLEQLAYDNKDDMLSHASDTLGYVAWHVFPMERPRRRATVSYK